MRVFCKRSAKHSPPESFLFFQSYQLQCSVQIALLYSSTLLHKALIQRKIPAYQLSTHEGIVCIRVRNHSQIFE